MRGATVCEFANCKNQAILNSKFCWFHTGDKKTYIENLKKFAKEGGSFSKANLSRADLSDFNFSRLDLSGANLYRANLSGSNFFDSNLKNAELLGADLSDSDLTGANLKGSDLTRCNLKATRLWHANLENANLIEADLSHSDLWNAGFSNARFWRTNFSQALSLSRKNFRFKLNKCLTVYRIDEKGFLSAEEAYRDLKKYFLANGRYDDASWASFKEKTMERLLLRKKGNFLAYLPSLIMNMLCGYGEKPHRIIFSSFFVVLLYSIIYIALNAVTYAQSAGYNMSLGDYIYYSVITFTTLGYGDFIPKSSSLFRSLAASEAFIGAFMIGLFIFTLARKYSAR